MIRRASEQLSPRVTTIQPVLQSLGAAAAEAHAPWSLHSAARELTAVAACAPQLERTPLAATRESSRSSEDPKIQ